jgi:hypothetical protein
MLGKTSRKGVLGKALLYPLNRWEALCRYRDDGRLEIDNLAAERALRGPVLAAKICCSSGRTPAVIARPDSIAWSNRRHAACGMAPIMPSG